MSASVTGKKQCVTCSKSGGIMTCDGCQRSFCVKHSIEHRQELTNQLDEIMQEHDLLQQELGQSLNDNSSLKQINKWEKESIIKIQQAAEAARIDLQQILDRSREKISKTCRDIAVNLRSSREADDFVENDLDQWMEQLKELKLELNSPPSIKLVEDETLSIPLIRINYRSSIHKRRTSSKHLSLTKDPALSVVQERFSQVFGGGIIQEDILAVRRVAAHGEYAHFLGERLYSEGRQTVRFRVGYKENVFDIFLGCTSSQSTSETFRFASIASAGWFGNNQVFHQGVVHHDDYNSSEIRTDDILSVIFDCENQQIELYHERTKKRHKVPIDLQKAPFPWRFLVVLHRLNDWVKIIPNV